MLINGFKNCFFRIHKLFVAIWITLWIILNIFIKQDLDACDTARVELVLQHYYTFFYPAALILLVIITFYPFIEGEGRELLYVHRRLYMYEAFIVFALVSCLMVFSVLVFWHSVLNNAFQFILKNVIVLWFFTGICYFLLYMFKKVAIMIMGAVLILLVVNFNPFGFLDVLQYDVTTQTNFELIWFMKEYLLMGAVCHVLAIVMNKAYCGYAEE